MEPANARQARFARMRRAKEARRAAERQPPLLTCDGPSGTRFQFWAWWENGVLYRHLSASGGLGPGQGGGGHNSDPLPGGRNVYVEFHSGHEGADSAVVLVAAPIAVTAHLRISDGTRQIVALPLVPGPIQVRVGVIAFSGRFELRRVDLFDADGRAVPVHEFG